jgi:hypothetical protein
MTNIQIVKFENLSNGAAIERANLELVKVLENIKDPNTSLKVCREINVKIKIKPSDDRSAGAVTIQATSKLAPVSEHMTQVYFGEDNAGNQEMSEVVQPTLFPEDFGNITPIKKGGTNNA